MSVGSENFTSIAVIIEVRVQFLVLWVSKARHETSTLTVDGEGSSVVSKQISVMVSAETG